jgi:hypothetical protein
VHHTHVSGDQVVDDLTEDHISAICLGQWPKGQVEGRSAELGVLRSNHGEHEGTTMLEFGARLWKVLATIYTLVQATDKTGIEQPAI